MLKTKNSQIVFSIIKDLAKVQARTKIRRLIYKLKTHRKIKDPRLVGIQWVSKTNLKKVLHLVGSQWVNKHQLKIKALHLVVTR